jgi:hypothetical protein
MKKIYIMLALVFLILTGLTIYSCKKDKTEEPDTANCDALLNAFTQAYSAFALDPQNSDKCEDFVQSFENYVDNCGTFLNEQQRQEYQDAVDAADCSN